MNKININSERVFKYFEDLCKIPRGSGNMEAISKFCLDFAEKHSLKAVRDDANNVIIFKDGSSGYENSEPVILQGHLDMVCQKTEDSKINFETDGLEIYRDGDFLKAKGTTLGADNGIAVAMVMALLERNDISHPPIEAVFTTDEEIGMIGAGKLSVDLLKGKKMINIDCENPQELTVSCAGGSDFVLLVPTKKSNVSGKKFTLTVRGLRGGHSGVEINSGRVNSNILTGRILNHMKNIAEFDILSITGGDKANAIPVMTTVEIVAENFDNFKNAFSSYTEIIKKEISTREPDFEAVLSSPTDGTFDVLDKPCLNKLIYMLCCVPNGVLEMSYDIDNLVETSLNLGILKTEPEKIILHFALRSNKQTALTALEEKLAAIADFNDCIFEAYGHYPPWEFKNDSELQSLYKSTYKELFAKEPKVVAIHAGLECGIFASKIEGLDCIAVGPEMHDIHTVNEKLSIPSTVAMYELILSLLEKSK